MIYIYRTHDGLSIEFRPEPTCDEWTFPSLSFGFIESSFVLGASGVIFIFISFFNEFPLSNHNSSRWDAAFCGVTSGAILFTYVQ